MQTVTSKDGTPIALDVIGDGPPVILVEGALNDLATTTPVAALLQGRYRGLVYDRRGRGGSGDTAPYSVSKEIEDLAAVVEAAGEPPFVFANCSGGALALEAARAGVPFRALALYEPPYFVDPDRSLPPNYSRRLIDYLDAGDESGALELFMMGAVQLPPEHVAQVRGSQLWPSLTKMAHTLRYDDAVMGLGELPPDRFSEVLVPTLVIEGAASPQWARNTVRALADQLPNGRVFSLTGHDHFLDPQAVAPVIGAFFDEHRTELAA